MSAQHRSAARAQPRLRHGQAVALMVLVTLLWSIAGVVTRHLEAARGFEVNFWRSFFNAVALVLGLSLVRGPRALWQAARHSGALVWASGLCWSVMFTAFMMALTLTAVANVLVTMAIAPLLTAVLAWLALGHPVALRTWVAIVAAGLGIAGMFGSEVGTARPGELGGMVVALAVPVAAALNWTLIQHSRQRRAAQAPDMLVPVLIGALLSALLTLPLAWPLQARPSDLGWLALLGVFQLAVPCALAVVLTRVLSAPEVSLLGLLEVVFGVAWAWLGAGEQPSPAVLAGGALVLGALVLNEWFGWRAKRVG